MDMEEIEQPHSLFHDAVGELASAHSMHFDVLQDLRAMFHHFAGMEFHHHALARDYHPLKLD